MMLIACRQVVIVDLLPSFHCRWQQMQRCPRRCEPGFRTWKPCRFDELLQFLKCGCPVKRLSSNVFWWWNVPNACRYSVDIQPAETYELNKSSHSTTYAYIHVLKCKGWSSEFWGRSFSGSGKGLCSFPHFFVFWR